MALQHTPLDPGALSEPARKVLAGPAPMRLMAARGLAPLPRPADLVSVIYQLAGDADAALKAGAEKTAGELPEKILAGALADPGLDPRVLDFFAAKVLGRGVLVDAILLNKATADETVAELAARLGEREIEVIAGLEVRLLRHPAIIGAIYMNPKARMSTVDRAVELAVRNQVTVPGVPGWEDVVAAVLGTRRPDAAAPPVSDEDFAAAAAIGIGDKPEAAAALAAIEAAETAEDEAKKKEEKTPIERLSVPGKIRLATLGNAFARSILVRDSNKQVALAAIRSPGLSDSEVVKFSGNRALCDEVVRVIANSKDHTKVYQVKVNLVNNPKCPLPMAMRFLPFLHDKDLRAVARSKGIPSALVSQANKLVKEKSQGGK
jgi:hypothetical protein